jgi:peptide/nickel transport system substrate-binding protein
VNRPLRKLALVAAMVLVGAAVVVASGSAGQAKSQIAPGGTLNVGWEQSFGATDNFDPTGEYLGDWFGIASSLLTRTLVGYNHVADGPGNVVVADIATVVPTVANGGITNGGKTYTFHLKHGIKFSPPVNREVTATDILTAMKRIANPKDGAQYAFYYSPIKGFDSGKGKSISGIKIINPYTIQFNLTVATGDFLYRMGMPATTPMPAEVTKCFENQAAKYGQDLVSTAGYMISGMDKVDISSCSAIKAASGYDGQTMYDLVRNPNYDPKTDSKAARENFPDEVKFVVDASAVDIENKIEAGQLDFAITTIPPSALKKYATTPSLKQYFHENSGDRTYYFYMNLTQPPFDDVHVRRAMNWIMDKAALLQGAGGSAQGVIANHIVPDSMFNNQLADYKPYATPGDAGSLAKAQAAMKGSKYDTKGNGMCSASACQNVLLVSDTRQVDTKYVPIIQADAKKIGITFKLRSVNGAYPTLQTPSNNVPISERPAWGKDYASASTFFIPLMASYDIIKNGNPNYSLVGLTPAIAKAVGAKGSITNVPSIDSAISTCQALVVPQANLSCYENLDKKLMTDIVPWVPFRWGLVTRITSKNVTQYKFDQFGTTPAYAHIAVK